MRSFNKKTWVLGALALFVALSVGSEPALAGKGGKKSARKSTPSTDTTDTTQTTTSSDYMTGGIDPTNTPVLSSDELLLAQSVEPTAGTTRLYKGDASLLSDVNAEVLDVLDAEHAHEVATGRGVVVAVLDAGFDDQHPAIAGRTMSGYDMVDGDADPNDHGNGFDDDRDGIVDGGVSHGTFTAAMVLLAAPDATIMPIRVRDDEGCGTDVQLADGINYAVKMGADIINLSVEGAPAPSMELYFALKNAEYAGVMTVTSAGNQGLEEVPADALMWLCTVGVGATDDDDNVAPFSNYDDSAYSNYVLAPGVDLFGPVGQSWGYWSGTSFATGIASGAAALTLQAYPGIRPSEVKDLMRATSETVKPHNGRRSRYTGRLDLRGMVGR